jgi:hypothetical protein
MSIEFDVFNSSDNLPTQETVLLNSKLIHEEEVNEGLAFTVCRKAVLYGAEVILTLMKNVGGIPPDGLKLKDIQSIAKTIVDKSIKPH